MCGVFPIKSEAWETGAVPAIHQSISRPVFVLESIEAQSARMAQEVLKIKPTPAAAVMPRQVVAFEKVGALENVNNVAKVGDFKYTGTVSNHLNDIIRRGPYSGELARPYMKSPQVIEEIMAVGKPIPDPVGIPGALRWDVPGAFRGSEGTWELVLHPESGIIYHFNFK